MTVAVRAVRRDSSTPALAGAASIWLSVIVLLPLADSASLDSLDSVLGGAAAGILAMSASLPRAFFCCALKEARRVIMLQ